ncbi:hypothetical protein SISSUDRAFT_1031146 [Sistotremastrum suecicum HHB10207 ss-3]|uniref:Uncharacterized protein n=1 Tax=Sistotremastrum suecicum HHB10207 ss-3 TaxID=1314776 RepID=A0A166GF18_9AGAM|nr:hypothetical protein SISSUDRAFT_1031146 [Sistotremastrum suecicum HHB10207 ss-3]
MSATTAHQTSSRENKKTASDASDQVPHQMRIVSGASIERYVAFALKYFEENPGRPLSLHTLPLSRTNPASVPAPDPDGEPKEAEAERDESMDEDSTPSAAQSNSTPMRSKRLSPTVHDIPRLLTVVEIIKREYLAARVRDARGQTAKDGPPGEAKGLEQYNELKCLEDLDTAPIESEPNLKPLSDAERTEQLMAMLDGKNHLKIKKTPFMIVTLCTTTWMAAPTDATYQPAPPPTKVSRNARLKAKKKAKKAAGSGES